MSVDRCQHEELVFQLTGQALHYDPPEGRPSGTPTVEVIRVATGLREAATTGPCSVDVMSTALEDAASPGRTTLSLADGTGVARGRPYLLSNAEGDREWIEVRAVDGARITTRRPLLFGYPTGSTLVGCRISIEVDPTWIADPSKLTDQPDAVEPEPAGYRLRWAYDVNGVALTGVSSADLVRRTALDLVTPMDVDNRFPGWLQRLPIEHREDQGADFIREAFAAVKLDALGNRHAMRRIRDAGVLCELVKLRANLINIEHGALFGNASTLDLTLAEQRYRTRRDELLCEPVDPSGAAARAHAAGNPGWTPAASTPWRAQPRVSSRDIIMGTTVFDAIKRGRPGRRS